MSLAPLTPPAVAKMTVPYLLAHTTFYTYFGYNDVGMKHWSVELQRLSHVREESRCCLETSIARDQSHRPRVRWSFFPIMTGQTKVVGSPLEGSNEKAHPSVRKSMRKANEPKETISERKLTTREKIILLEASKLHGSRFPPWTSPPMSSVFEQSSGQPYFT